MADVLVCDVAPRDGLQNDAVVLEPGVRAELCARLAAAGLRRVEAGSFVSPRHVPAMAGAEQVFALLAGGPPVTEFTALVLNERGFDRALAADVRRVNVTVAVTEAFCERNQGCTRAEAVALLGRLGARAADAGIPLTATLAVSFGCPFEGAVDPAHTVALAEHAVAAGVDEVVLADTIGVAEPAAVGPLVEAVRALGVRTGGHFHDTRGNGVANCLAALEAGAEVLDASTGGVGGCPFAPGATGNVATEDVVAALHDAGVDTGTDPGAIADAATWLGAQLGRTLHETMGARA